MSIVHELKGAVGGEREVLRNGRGAGQYHKCDLKAEGGGCILVFCCYLKIS